MMAERGDNNFIRYIYRGEEGEIIPDGATHIIIAEGVTFVRARAFQRHPNIIEVICLDKVEKIEHAAFYGCHSLKRVIMPGVKVVERNAFEDCKALENVECGKLEIIKAYAFGNCEYLMSINLPSARIIEEEVFFCCYELRNVKFGGKLERVEEAAFYRCESLERIAIPLKDGIISADNIFQLCAKLRQVDLVEGAELHETIAALQLEEWRNDMNEVIDYMNQNLRNLPAGEEWDDHAMEWGETGEKALAIRTWLRSVLGKINHYKAQHQHVLDEAVSTLHHVLPCDILVNNALPFLALPEHTFEVEDLEEDDDEDGLEVEHSSQGEDSEQDSYEERGDHYLGEERNGVSEGQEEDQEEYGQDETAQRRVKRQRLNDQEGNENICL